MKKLFLFSILLCSFISCQEEVKFNSPAFEAKKDGVLWRAVDTKVTLYSNGSLTIEGYTSKEKFTLKTISTTPQIYPLGTGVVNLASYVVTDSKGTTTYSTGDKIGDGEIVIEEYDAVNKTVTGTFKCNMENSDANSSNEPIVNYQYGKFYKVPVNTMAL